MNEALTIFAGLRYEYLGNFVEKHNLLINFDPVSGSLVLPDASIAQFLSPQAIATVPQVTAEQAGVGPSLVNTDTNNVSPRVGFAWRVSTATVIRGGTGLFYPTAAAQGVRDALSRSPFRYGVRYNQPALAQGFTTGTVSPRSFFGVNAVDLNLQSPEVLQYNVTLERELGAQVGVRVSFIGSEMRKLLVNRDLNTMPASTTPFDLDDPADHARLPYPNLDPFLNAVLNAGDGWFRALQIEATRRFNRGLSIEAAYTRAASESTAPDLGNSSLGVVQYNPYDLEQDRGPDPQVPQPSLHHERHLGAAGRPQPDAPARAARLGGRGARRLDGERHPPGAQRQPADAVLRLRHRSDLPGEHRPRPRDRAVLRRVLAA